MRTRFASWVAAAASLAALVAVLAIGCGAPDDETLLRFLGFQAAGDTGTGTISMIPGDVQDGQPLKVDASFENETAALLDANAAGITIYRVEVDYTMAGMDPPSFAFPVKLYAPPATSKDATGGGKVVLSDIPIVPASVKQWLIAHNASAGKGVIEMTAKATFRAKTDAGEELSVDGALAVTLKDGEGGGPEPEVTIQATIPTAIDTAPVTNGQFRIIRIGDKTAILTVSYEVQGTASPDIDYNALPGTLTISSGSGSDTINVIPRPDTTTEENKTVIVILQDGAGYSVGVPSSATVTISDRTVKPTVTVQATVDTAVESPKTTGEFTIFRTGPTSGTLSVSYVLSGTAVNGTDYDLLNDSVTISAGSSSAKVTVTPSVDAIAESPKDVVLTLKSGASYSLGDPNTATVTIKDTP